MRAVEYYTATKRRAACFKQHGEVSQKECVTKGGTHTSKLAVWFPLYKVQRQAELVWGAQCWMGVSFKEEGSSGWGWPQQCGNVYFLT